VKHDSGIGSGGAMGWFAQRITGLLLLPVVIVHILATHYVMGNPARGALELDYHVVAARLASPWWKLLDLAFLGIVLYHGLRGIWVILQESIHRPPVRITLFCVAIILGGALAVLGAVTILPFRGVAR
jgi:succinate dehydrogenase / fumarate reductase membrane anchor subunit